MKVETIGIIIIGAVFGFGFLALGIYMLFEKNPINKIPKPPFNLKNNYDNKTNSKT